MNSLFMGSEPKSPSTLAMTAARERLGGRGPAPRGHRGCADLLADGGGGRETLIRLTVGPLPPVSH